MNKREILTRINEIIDDEKGRAVKMTDMFIDAELDSLGTMIAMITIDSEFEIFDPDKVEEDMSDLDIKNLTVRDLVTKCILSNINQSTELSKEKNT